MITFNQDVYRHRVYDMQIRGIEQETKWYILKLCTLKLVHLN